MVDSAYSQNALAAADADRLMGLLGVVLVIYAGLSLAMLQVPPPGRWEPWLSPLIGAVSGLMTGMTGSFVVPGSLYLQALGMPREMLIQTLGISFATVTVVLVAGMGGHGLITLELGVLSAIAVILAGLGMALGTRLRRRIPEAQFRRTFFWALLMMGVYVTWRAFA